FSLSDKYYVDYELDKEEELNLKYNGSNLFNNDEKIIGKAKGKYIAILFGLSSLTIFASIIAICIIFGIHPSAI
ncbi:MAG: hypothetical protein K6A63_04980, partial [Acholeplasmatales bacterium]|nr:hypothetical protein [Acholeplasmatales bacterium]